jgi:hypothetical protein
MENSKKSPAELQKEDRDKASLLLFGISCTDAIAKKICLSCKQKVNVDSYSEIDKEAYLNSGVCATCLKEAAESFKKTCTPEEDGQ